jgi:hypothetical protein
LGRGQDFQAARRVGFSARETVHSIPSPDSPAASSAAAISVGAEGLSVDNAPSPTDNASLSSDNTSPSVDRAPLSSDPTPFQPKGKHIMTQRTDWLPGKREEQIALSKNWQTILVTAKTTAWNIPATEVTALKTLTSTAETALELSQSSARTVVITAQTKAAFTALTEKMRFFKSRYFLIPPLLDADLISLGLKPHDTKPTPIPPPIAQAEADITYPAAHTLELHLRPLTDAAPDPHRSDYGFRIYFGIMPSGGATLEAAASLKHELMTPPVTGDELPHSNFTRRKRERMDFSQEESGKTIYFCIRYENAKGEPGPWGPIFSAVIP